MRDFKIIAIDGPSGSGKSTIARLLAKEKKFLYVDTGAMFRCLAYVWKLQGMNERHEVLQQLGENTNIRFELGNKVFCNGLDVSEVIRKEEISQVASQISRYSAIRLSMKEKQRQIVKEAKRTGKYQGAVLEGRDIGTVIFPDATFKFFLDGEKHVRAQRRHQQLLVQGEDLSFEEISNALEIRDSQDSARELAPLLPAEDAIHVDSTHLSISQVLKTISEQIR